MGGESFTAFARAEDHLAAAFERPDHPCLGQDAGNSWVGNLGIKVASSFEK